MENYYNPMDEKSVMACLKSYESEGLKTSLTKRRITIKRETSMYNKCMKWHVEMWVDGHCFASEYFKSEPEAYRHLTKTCRPMPIGDSFSFHINNVQEVTNG